jgi:hypothetical protein
MKEALGTLVSAFMDKGFGYCIVPGTSLRKLFSSSEPTLSFDKDSGFGVEYDYQVGMYRKLLGPTVSLMEEIHRPIYCH